MFSIMGDPRVAARIVRHQIDKRIRDAEARRTARAIRRSPRGTFRFRRGRGRGPASAAGSHAGCFGADDSVAGRQSRLDQSTVEGADRVLVD